MTPGRSAYGPTFYGRYATDNWALWEAVTPQRNHSCISYIDRSSYWKGWAVGTRCQLYLCYLPGDHNEYGISLICRLCENRITWTPSTPPSNCVISLLDIKHGSIIHWYFAFYCWAVHDGVLSKHNCCKAVSVVTSDKYHTNLSTIRAYTRQAKVGLGWWISYCF